MPITKPPVLPAWADAGDKVQPTDLEIQVGWPLSAVPPSRQRFNWLQNFLANGVRYFSRRGLVDYDAAENYMIGDRVNGPDGKSYVSIQDNNTNHTPSASPTWWIRWAFASNEVMTAATPAQFDATTKVATMEAVKRAGVEYAGTRIISSAASITAADAGKVLLLGSNGGYAVALPLLSTFPDGGVVEISCYAAVGTGDITINRAGADVIFNYNGTSVTSLVLKRGQNVTLVKSLTGAGWYAIAGSGRGDNYADYGISGRQLLPSGILLQWLTITTGTGGTTSFNWPITYPNAFLKVLATPISSTATFANTNATNTGGGNCDVWNTSGSRVSQNVHLLGIGY